MLARVTVAPDKSNVCTGRRGDVATPFLWPDRHRSRSQGCLAEDVTKVNISGQEHVILYLTMRRESRPRVGGGSQATISRGPDVHRVIPWSRAARLFRTQNTTRWRHKCRSPHQSIFLLRLCRNAKYFRFLLVEHCEDACPLYRWLLLRGLDSRTLPEVLAILYFHKGILLSFSPPEGRVTTHASCSLRCL